MTAFEVVENNNRFGMLAVGFMDPKMFRETASEVVNPRIEQRPPNERLADIAIKGAQDYEISDAVDG